MLGTLRFPLTSSQSHCGEVDVVELQAISLICKVAAGKHTIPCHHIPVFMSIALMSCPIYASMESQQTR
jgi:hypothetical protein